MLLDAIIDEQKQCERNTRGHWSPRWELLGLGLAARGVQGATTPPSYAYLQLEDKLACWATLQRPNQLVVWRTSGDDRTNLFGSDRRITLSSIMY
jgi:hypothetical protein